MQSVSQSTYAYSSKSSSKDEIIISLFHHFLSVFINMKIKLWHSINTEISKYFTESGLHGAFNLEVANHICCCLLIATWQRKTHRFLWAFVLPKLLPPVSVLLKPPHVINATSEFFLITAVDHQKLDFFLLISVFKLICGKRWDREKSTSDWISPWGSMQGYWNNKKFHIQSPLHNESQHFNMEYGHATISLGRY